jgi:hypothetical protein
LRCPRGGADAGNLVPQYAAERHSSL